MATDVIASYERLRSWQLRIFGLLWGGYASYCLCRVNFAVAQPLILREFPAWTSAQIGSIPSTYAVAYAAGQIVNGTLGERRVVARRHMRIMKQSKPTRNPTCSRAGKRSRPWNTGGGV